MSRFKQWFKGTFNPGKDQTKDDDAKPLPLTKDDDATLEPLPLRTEWPQIPTSRTTEETTANYGLFRRMPLELRRQILNHAFGSRTLHVDLAFDHPYIRKSVHRSDTKARHNHCDFGSDLVRDPRNPKQWQWFSCVCHRRLVRTDEEGLVLSGRTARIEPCEDGCIPGRRIGKRDTQRDPSTPSADDMCHIGVMGWLLACRQAYVDGIHVLYGTNTFHLASLPLLLDLPRLMSPQRLAAITSLELLLTFTSPDLFDDETIKSVWDHALAPPLNTSAEDKVERVILGPVEDMFRCLGPGPGKHFSFAIQRGGWQVLADRLTQQDPRAQQFFESFDDSSYQERLWKPLGDDGSGYWLRPGWDDFAVFGREYWMFDIWRTGGFRGGF
ncbi:hypothetical protein C8A00DRAFT_46737 [Chaetomidium leptoderma]|uniref:DUF7730 domain-containing protein n=1 Tax=Chaetomidium leptoderma TaxID=669021 RepID=A0AAN6VDY7_9PEZI|nr:hypothetical protein C8A00DRAFT_46737 [Chaetomidium leptoderma]